MDNNLKLGLVLSGGGAKGAYQLGVFKAMSELRLTNSVCAVSGCSIGSINALAFAAGSNIRTNALWKALTAFAKNELPDKKIADELNQKIDDYLKEKDKIPTISFLEENAASDYKVMFSALSFILNAEAAKKSNIDIYSCIYDIEASKSVYIKVSDLAIFDLTKVICASASLPFIVKPVQHDGRYYLDGGANSKVYKNQNADSVALAPLLPLNLDHTILVYLNHRTRQDVKTIKEHNVIEICPTRPLEDSPGSGTLDFSAAKIRSHRELGYKDAMNVLTPFAQAFKDNINIEELLSANIDNVSKIIEENII